MMGRPTMWLCLIALTWEAKAAEPRAERLARSTVVLEQFREKATETTRTLLDAALCVGVAPRRPRTEVAEGGQGFVSCRANRTAAWSNPAAFVVEGGGVSWEVEGAEFDLLLAATNPKAAAVLSGPRVLLSADVDTMPGPTRPDQVLPRMNEYPTIFAWEEVGDAITGIRIGGGTIREDQTANAGLYGREISTAAVLKGGRSEQPAAEVERFLACLPGASPAGGRKLVLAEAP
jgi:lipid-binding SYLF domain-containing protein